MQALQEVTRYGTNSLFTQLMANESVDAVATAADIRPFPGDSFSDQVLGYTATSSTPSKPPIGLPVGCAIGGAFFLAATAVLIVYAHRQRKQNKLHKVRALLRNAGPVSCSLLHRTLHSDKKYSLSM